MIRVSNPNMTYRCLNPAPEMTIVGEHPRVWPGQVLRTGLNCGILNLYIEHTFSPDELFPEPT